MERGDMRIKMTPLKSFGEVASHAALSGALGTNLTILTLAQVILTHYCFQEIKNEVL